ncbi:MAG: hypothetical protein VKJ04_05520 [Vampirovibrionales bacterium]|nr:hypothetical protein [Vampirovibrionales bacterium]
MSSMNGLINGLMNPTLMPPALSGSMSGSLLGPNNTVGVSPLGTATIGGSPILANLLSGTSALGASSSFGSNMAGIDASGLGLGSLASSLGGMAPASNNLAASLQASSSLGLSNIGGLGNIASLGSTFSSTPFSNTSMAAPMLALDTSSNLGAPISASGSASALFLGDAAGTMATIQQQNAMIQEAIGVASAQIMQAQIQQAIMAAQQQAALQAAQQAAQQMLTSAPVTLAAAPASGAAAPINQTQLSADLDRLIVGGTAQQRAQLKQNLMAISQDPDGQKLLNESIRRGVTFAAGNPGAIAGAADKGTVVNCPTCAAAAAQDASGVANDGEVIVRGVTVTRNGQSAITVADPNNLKTLVHEMVHATSTQDGNSREEEGLANVLGRRVEARLLGTALEDPNVTFSQTFAGGTYSELAQSNGIRNTLAQLGIRA